MTVRGRPLVTLILPVFRNQPYLEAAIRSVLAQDYSPLQIAISDDASPDDAFDAVTRLTEDYRGPHTIRLNRNPENLGMGNYNALMDMAEGKFIVVAHDDDISMPHRVSRLTEAWQQSRASMVTSNFWHMTADGTREELFQPEGHDQKISLRALASQGRSPLLVGSAIGWDREIFEAFGPIDPKRTYKTSDYVLPFRAALLKGIRYLHEPLLDCRRHEGQRGNIGRAQKGKASQAELLSERLAQLAYMDETLRQFQQKHPLRSLRTAGLRGRLLRAMGENAAKLGILRNQLMARGRMMRWVRRDKK